MANYVETIIGPGEQVLYVGKVSLLSILPSLIGGALLILVGLAFTAGAGPIGLIFAVLGAIVLLVALIRRNIHGACRDQSPSDCEIRIHQTEHNRAQSSES
jgi:hypothetical protein